jgi:hypothetical protein
VLARVHFSGGLVSGNWFCARFSLKIHRNRAVWGESFVRVLVVPEQCQV